MAKNIGIRVMFLAMVLFVCGFAAAASAETSGAEQLIQKLPDEIIGFVATSGGDELKPAFEKTILGKMWNDPNVQTFVKSIKSEIINKIKAENNDANSAKIFDDVVNFIDILLKRPVVLGAASDRNAKKVPVYGFAIVEAGSRQIEIARSIIRLESLAPKGEIVDVNIAGMKMHAPADTGDVPGYWGWVGSYFVFAINDKDGIVVKNLKGSRSGPAVNYLADVEGSGDAIVLYADFQKLAGLIKFIVQQEGQEGQDGIKIISAVMKELGLADVKSLKARVGFSGADVVKQELLEIPQPRTGIPAKLRNIDLSIFDVADSRSDEAVAFNVDLAGIYDLVFNSIKIASPNDVYPQAKNGIAEVESKLGFSIRNDLLAGFAGPAIFYSVSDGGSIDTPAGAVLVARAENAQALEKSLKSINALLDPNSNSVIRVSSQVQDGRTYYSYAVMQLAAMRIIPTWTIVNNQLVIGTNSQLCSAAANRVTSIGMSANSIRTTAGFKKVTAKLPANLVCFGYVDSKIKFKAMMTQVQQFWPMATMMAAGGGFRLPVMLPSLDHIINQAGPTSTYSYYDSKGLHVSYRGTGIEASTSGVAGGAMAMGILMPSLTKTRQVAQRVVSGSHLASIGKVFIIYANDNNDVYPPDLKTLVEKADLSPKCLESSRKPKDFTGPSFTYIPGQNSMMDAGNVLVYENPEFCRDGVNVLFNDGHVEFMKPEEFKKAFEETYKRLGKPAPEIKFGK
jgi:prepilin-type processing-associated H-X9-DG protein